MFHSTHPHGVLPKLNLYNSNFHAKTPAASRYKHKKSSKQPFLSVLSHLLPSRIKIHTESEKTAQNARKRLKDPNRQS